MAVDLNKVAQKLREQRGLGVTRDGRLTDNNPDNDGTRREINNTTTLEPKRFFQN